MANLMIWYPDTCPPGGQCVIRQNPDCSLNLIITLCPHHMGVKFNNSLSDADVYRAIKAGNKLREAARYTAKIELGLPKDDPGLPCVTGSDGNFTILTGAKGTKLTSLKNAVSTTTATLEKPTGTSTVTVA